MMNKAIFALTGLLLTGLAGTGYGMGTEHIGPASEKKAGEVNYFETAKPAGVALLLDHPARVYSCWVNGREDVYYNADSEQANELLALFSKLPLQQHICLIDAQAPGQVCTFKQQEIGYTLQLVLPEGIYLSKAQGKDDVIYWPSEAQLILAGHDAKAFADRLTVPENVRVIEKTTYSKELIAPVVGGNTAFAFDLYARLRDKPGNLFFSPYSISTALAMTYAGARGSTREQMAHTLCFFEPDKSFHRAYGHLVEHLNRQGWKGDYQLSIANALWLQKDYHFLPDFLSVADSHYDASFQEVDFGRETEQSRQKINDWTAKRTQDKITELIPEGVLDELTRLVLTNAIYFKGDWASQFKADQTQDADFAVSAKKMVKTPLMHQEGDFNYGQTDALQILELPYKGQDLSMLVLLPKETDGLERLEKELSVENLSRWQKQMHVQEAVVYLPKFKVTSQFELTDTLSTMGMPDAFGGNADFSGMDGTKFLFISDVIHKAFVEVSETGTEAAAATAVMVSLRALPMLPLVFRADHPFVFLIKDNSTGSILFVGRVIDPTQGD